MWADDEKDEVWTGIARLKVKIALLRIQARKKGNESALKEIEEVEDRVERLEKTAAEL